MLSFQTIAPHTLELLRNLMQEPCLAGTRLVGGTALALQYGHRNSVDLDFFGRIEGDSQRMKERIAAYGKVEVTVETENIKGYKVDGIKIDIVNYQYSWIDNAIVEDGIRLASPQDIAAMKVNAIEGRGSRKDFIDIYFLLQHYSLAEILKFYKQKYPEHSEFRALMSLDYFDDAEQYPMPVMYVNTSWETMKQYISSCVREYSKSV